MLYKRSLLYYRIIHAKAEMGSLHKLTQQLITETAGNHVAKKRVEDINLFWKYVADSVNNLVLKHTGIRIYQDGLPVCNRESDIVKDLASAGSVNHQLILKLQQEGANLMGSESAELLQQEYTHIKNFITECSIPNTIPDIKNFKLQSSIILKQRDVFIAKRINDTLGKGETGILFLGQLHHILPYLNPDICVIFPKVKSIL